MSWRSGSFRDILTPAKMTRTSMLTQATFTNYRGFKSFKMDGLATVNLLVGKNNSGKTSLLEGLEFLASGGRAKLLYKAAHRRNEASAIKAGNRVGFYARYLIHGRELRNGASFGIDDGSEKHRVVVRFENRIVKRSSNAQSGKDAITISRPRMSIDVSWIKEPHHHTYAIAPGGLVILRDYILPTKAVSVPAKTRSLVKFIGTEMPDDLGMGRLWTQVVRGKRQPFVVDALRILDHHVRSIDAVDVGADQGLGRPMPGFLLDVGEDADPIPLGSFGEGMSRIFVMAASLACCKGGLLFADEVDTGLHYSIMDRMWAMIVQRAVKTETQVFATTHSWDCLTGLAAYLKDHSEMAEHVAVHKINSSLERSIPFKGMEIADAVENGVELR